MEVHREDVLLCMLIRISGAVRMSVSESSVGRALNVQGSVGVL